MLTDAALGIHGQQRQTGSHLKTPRVGEAGAGGGGGTRGRSGRGGKGGWCGWDGLYELQEIRDKVLKDFKFLPSPR